MGVRNPEWTRDELILALDLYFSLRPGGCGAAVPEVVTLSRRLRRLGVHKEYEARDTFRNPTGVSMKLSNFLRFDPGYEGVGLARGSKRDGAVWREFYDDRAGLRRLADAIRSFADDRSTRLVSDEKPEAEPAPEGRVLTHAHKVRERNGALRRRKVEQALQRTGCLRCEACGFDFEGAYGGIGSGYIECHHTTPLAELRPGTRTRLADLALVLGHVSDSGNASPASS